MDRAKADVLCTICKASFKVTIRNVEANAHVGSKHAKSTFEKCFPSLCEQEEEEEVDLDDPLPESKKAWKCIFTGN